MPTDKTGQDGDYAGFAEWDATANPPHADKKPKEMTWPELMESLDYHVKRIKSILGTKGAA